MRDSAYFSNKHVVVTGGSSGIGLALGQRLAGLGAEVTLVARRLEPLNQAKSEIESQNSGAKVHVLSVDVSDQAQVSQKVAAHLAENPVDMLINNAGVAMPGRFLEMDAQEFRRQMDINFFGMVHMCRQVVPHLIERGGGHVCNVGSLLSVMGIYGYSAYAASKFAMQGFTECIRGELKPHNIAVTMLQPPDTDTPQHAAEIAHLPAETKAIAGNVKMLSAERVAQTCLSGMAAGRFEIFIGVESQVSILAHRTIPSLVRWVCDSAQKKASSSTKSSSSEAEAARP